MLHGDIHRHLLILSIANWAIAIACWTLSSYLGIAVPTSIFVYAILFVIGLFAAVVAIIRSSSPTSAPSRKRLPSSRGPRRLRAAVIRVRRRLTPVAGP